LSSSTGQINGISYFFGSSENCGLISLGEFFANSNNLGTVSTATFSDNAENNCIILEQVDFFENAINNKCVCGIARFNGDSLNGPSGQLANEAVFCDGAVNCGTIIGEACFYGTSSNSGVVTVAYFNESASNLGTISGSGLFFGTSVNSGIISGNAVFADTTVNNGTVEGSGSFATGASNQGGTVNGGSGVYTPPSSGLWYDDTSSAARIVALNGVVTQEDEGSGVLVADFNNGYLSVTNPMSLSTGDFTVEYFIKYDSAVIGYQPGVALYTPNAGDYNATINIYLEIANYFNVLMTNSAGNSWQTYVPGNDHGPQVAPVANQWNHVAATRSGNTLALYLNGILIGTNSINDTTIYDVNRVLEIGRYTAFPGGSLSLYGRIAGLRIVKGAVVYSGSTYTIPTTLLTAISGTELLLNFGASAAPTVANWYDDASSAAHVVTLNGNVTQSDEGSGVKAATSNAVASYLSAPTTAISTSDFTWEAFIKTSSTASAPTILFGQYGSDGLVAFVQVGSSTIRISTLAYGFDTSTAVTLDAWNHFVVQRTSGTITAYLNGYLVATNSVIGGINETNFIINGSSGSTAYNNSIAGFRYVLGTALYSGSTITIPTSLPTNISGTELLLNFGATAAPTVLIRNGAYSDGYYSAGILDTTYNAATPTDAAQDDALYYTYASGVATAASGAYSNGYYAAGTLSGTSATPAQAQDNNSWYTYVNGVPTAASGAYSNGYYTAGEINVTYDAPAPIQAQDNSLFYVYASGVATIAVGPYSNGYYKSGGDSGQFDTTWSGSAITQDTSSCTLFANGVAGSPGSGTC
jgi:hypothetical protein